MSRLVILLVSTVLLSGCMHRSLPNVPKTWHNTVEISPNELEDKPNVASMQLLIMYGAAGCNHTASRYYCPGKGAVFWDPGGGYGTKGYAQVDRQQDVIIENVPTLNDYLNWRTLVPTVATEIFIWEGHNEEICELHDLMTAASRKERLRGFTSKTAGLFCSAATSEFFRDYAQELMQVKKWGLPHNLSKQLHKQKSADKILIIRNKKNMIEQYYP